MLTEALLVWFMFRYAYDPRRKARYVEGNHRLELVWTVATARILVWIAFAQVSVWERIKYQGLMPEPYADRAGDGPPVGVATSAIHAWTYDQADAGRPSPGPRRRRSTTSALPMNCTPGSGAKVRIYLKTRDVIHSFGLPNLRLMQDALPGKTIPMWFKATRGEHAMERGGRPLRRAGRRRPGAGRSPARSCAAAATTACAAGSTSIPTRTTSGRG